MRLALIAGAGFSKAVGLPLTREIFNEIPHEPNPTADIIGQHEMVKLAWLTWSSNHPNLGSEQWLKEIYVNRSVSESADKDWHDTIRFLTARLGAESSAIRTVVASKPNTSGVETEQQWR